MNTDRLVKYFRNPLLLAIFILLLAVIWLGFFDANNLIEHELRVHLLAGVIDSIFGLIIIDRILSYRETKRNVELRRIGLKRLGQPLKIYTIFWYRCGGLPSSNPNSNESIGKVITNDTFIKSLKAKDFATLDGTGSWFRRLVKQRDQFRRELSAILSVYITVFDSKEVELIDYFIQTSGIDYQIEYGKLAPDPNSNPLFQKVIPHYLKDYMEKIGELVDCYNSVTDFRMDDSNVCILNSLPEFWDADKEEMAKFLGLMTPDLVNKMIDTAGDEDNIEDECFE